MGKGLVKSYTGPAGTTLDTSRWVSLTKVISHPQGLNHSVLPFQLWFALACT